jgi:NAD(P)-dependent dehydrogenase (short-subunit alcohol dehydrogenase family)
MTKSTRPVDVTGQPGYRAEAAVETLLRQRPGLRESARARVDGMVALVTGAGAQTDDVVGVGQAISIVLAAAGARVVVVDLDERAADNTVQTIAAVGGEGLAVVGDVRRPGDCAAVVSEAMATFGSIDALVNNAAIIGPGADLHDDDTEFQAILDVNLMGTIRMSRAAVPAMRRGGAVVQISSLGALRSFGNLAYEASKGAINTLITSMSVQLGPSGVRVNGVCPGQMWTPMGMRNLRQKGYTDEEIAAQRERRRLGLPLQTEGTGWDIGAAALFLASQDARWITGQLLVVDGGQSGVVGYVGTAPA